MIRKRSSVSKEFWDSIDKSASKANKVVSRKIKESYKQNIKDKKESEYMSLVGKKVRVRVDSYDTDILSPKFIKFLEDNKDKVFTAIQEPKYRGTDLYCLAEDPTWIFFATDLELVKFEGEL